MPPQDPTRQPGPARRLAGKVVLRLAQLRSIAPAFARLRAARGGTLPALRTTVDKLRSRGVRQLLHGLARRREQALRYVAWIDRQDQLDAQALRESPPPATRTGADAGWPLISVVMPTYETDASYLAQVIASVQAQHYPHWELCIADDASPTARVREDLRAQAARDARIRLVERAENGHISAASNAALALASGEFVALLDHDDILHPMALYWVARAIREHPDAGLVYTDEDKIDDTGRRHTPVFKAGFNPDLLLGQNAISHLGVYRTSLVRALGGFRLGLEGSQDWDLALRVTEQLAPGQVVHVPLVLYHWREHPASTASSQSAKPYTVTSAERAVREHLARLQIDAKVDVAPEIPTMLRVRHGLPSPAPSVEILIPTRDRANLLRRCIDSIARLTTYPGYAVCLIDNGTTEPQALSLLDEYARRPGFRVLRDDRPFNYAALNNAAASTSGADYLCLLNNDIEVITPEWLDELVSRACQPGVGCVGARLWYPDDRLQHGGVVLGIAGVANHAHHGFRRGELGYLGWMCLAREMSAVTGACLVVARRTYVQVGGLDESLAIAFNDIDFCLKVRQAGLRNVWTPFAELYHHESASRGAEASADQVRRLAQEAATMMARWGALIRSDPNYSPHLTRIDGSYAIAPVAPAPDA